MFILHVLTINVYLTKEAKMNMVKNVLRFISYKK